ncbi:U1 small nuclear ribonucleoprotein 70 kDa [bacterium]|nr:U1 small nuclear ribonucleoprotein 70 kDa [bacterium]
MSLKPAPASLRDLPRAPPGAFPPGPGGYAGGLPPAPQRGGYGPPGLGYAGGGPRPTQSLPPRGGMGGGPGTTQHQTGLPPNLLALFEARPPLEYMPAPARPKKTLALTGVANLVGEFEETTDGNKAGDGDEKTDNRVPVSLETREKRLLRIAKEKKRRHAESLDQEIAKYDPKANDDAGDSDPYKTLFVGRLAYEADENSVRGAMEKFGDVRTVSIVKDKSTGTSKGYAFVEFTREDDMKAAYRGANGRVIEGRAVVVDAERGRTVPDWRPRRLGGRRRKRQDGENQGERHK